MTTSKRQKPSSTPKRQATGGGSKEANRLVVAILEVLAGVRSPTEAAEALKISLPRYYILETRALEGMVAACEPRPLGKQPSLEARIAKLEKELQQAHREVARQQALVRVAQRSVGLTATETQKGKPSPKRDKRGRKRRRPTVRALKAAETLRGQLDEAAGSGVQETVADGSVPAPDPDMTDRGATAESSGKSSSLPR